jgi:hypothetical protein
MLGFAFFQDVHSAPTRLGLAAFSAMPTSNSVMDRLSARPPPISIARRFVICFDIRFQNKPMNRCRPRLGSQRLYDTA